MSDLSDKERDLAARVADNPLDLFQGKSIGWLEDFIRITIGGGSTSGSFVAGDMKVIAKDLTAETGVYVYEDASGQWLYCNGAAASQTTYATLYAFFGANAYAADSGGNFILPDCRGRALHFAGTNAATDLNDNDGVAEASRTPTQSASITGTTDAESSHTHGAGSYGVVVPANGANGAGTGAVLGATTYAVTGTSGAGSSHSHTVTGAGNVTFPHLHAGSLLVKF